MFERFKNRSDETNGNGGRTAVADRPATDDPATGRGGNGTTTRTAAAGGPAVATREHMHTARARQRAEYGGINWGAAFFGWLVAVGLGSLLVAILAAAGAAVGLTQNVTTADAKSNADTLSLGGAIALIVVLMIAYYAGGYVAGRMSRFDGARQGIAVGASTMTTGAVIALIAVVVGTLLAAMIGGKAGERYHRKVDRVGFVD
jgi:amino acid transporter